MGDRTASTSDMLRHGLLRTLAIASATLCASLPAQSAADQAQKPAASKAQCTGLASLAGKGLVIGTAELVAAGPLAARPGAQGPSPVLPEHCLVRGVINPRTGAGGRQFGIGFELRLPLAWTGRFLFQGGGGLDGQIMPAIGNIRYFPVWLIMRPEDIDVSMSPTTIGIIKRPDFVAEAPVTIWK